MMSIGYRFQGSNTHQVSHVSRSSQPWVSQQPRAPGSSLPAAGRVFAAQEVRGDSSPISLRGCSQGLPPDPGAIPLPVQTWEGEERGKKNFPTWTETMGTKPRFPGTDCRGGGNVSSAPRRLNGLLKKNPLYRIHSSSQSLLAPLQGETFDSANTPQLSSQGVSAIGLPLSERSAGCRRGA